MNRMRTNDRSSRGRGGSSSSSAGGSYSSGGSGSSYSSGSSYGSGGSGRGSRFGSSAPSRSGGSGYGGGSGRSGGSGYGGRRSSAVQGEFALPKTITPALPAVEAFADLDMPAELLAALTALGMSVPFPIQGATL
ncbi:hypothetical protein ACFWU6_07875, partial [Streptomyces sp. NPDC058674]